MICNSLSNVANPSYLIIQDLCLKDSFNDDTFPTYLSMVNTEISLRGGLLGLLWIFFL